MNYQTILVPTDYSIHSDRAVDHAVALARLFTANIFLLHVVQNGSHAVGSGISRAGSTAQATALHGVTVPSDVPVRTRVVSGEPYFEILRMQQQIDADLIVIGHLGESSRGGFLFGHTADKIVRRAKCSVLVVKP